MAGIDKTLVQRRFRRSAASYRKAALVQRETARKLLDHFHLAAGEREFDRILEIGAGDGVLTELVETRFDYRELVLLDLVPEWEPFHRERPRCRFLAGDVETVELPGPFDLILSNAVFQWVEDLDRLFRRLAEALRPGGWLGFSTFGPANLREIAELTGRGLRYPAPAELDARLGSRFEPVARHEELHRLEFDSPLEILRHLKATGVTATGVPARWTGANLRSFEEEYRKFRLENGRFPLTYHPILYIARKRQTT